MSNEFDYNPDIQSNWVLRPWDEEAVINLVHRCVISPWTARILVSRGITDPDKAADFLRPESCPLHDPAKLPGIDDFLTRIEKAIKSDEKVIIHGDYDADGITSAAIMRYALSNLRIRCEVYLPSRFHTGYGIDPDWITAQKEAGFSLIVTTDCGSSAIESVQRANEVGIDLIITDHHTPNPELTGAAAHVNPHLPGSEYPFHEICGAGVAYKLACALKSKIPPSFQKSYSESLPVELAMIGTLADVMPLIDENRRIVMDGFEHLRRYPSVGLKALLEGCRSSPEAANAELILFQVAPRLNAAGRLRSPMDAFRLIVETDPEKADRYAKELEKANTERKKLAADATEQALRRIREEKPQDVVLMADPDWNRGILGIIAARVMEAFGLPVFVGSIDDGLIHGSCRVPEGFNAARILDYVSELLDKGGGHSAAAGFTLQAARWEEFVEGVRSAIREHRMEITQVENPIDAFLGPDTPIDLLFNEFSGLEPFGNGFPLPSFAITRFDGRGKSFTFGSNHLKINLGGAQKPIEAVGYSLGDWQDGLRKKMHDVLIEHGANKANGRSTARPKILALRPALKENAETYAPESVTRFDGGEGLAGLVLWDSRGLPPLACDRALRIGYGPGWRKWWHAKIPGSLEALKKIVWKNAATLPMGEWPGTCSAGYGDEEIPSEWDGEWVEILWPPIQKTDSAWLRSILSSNGGKTLVRLAYDPIQLRAWVDLQKAELTRDTLALVFRAILGETPIDQVFALDLKPMAVALALEVLHDMGHIRLMENALSRSPQPEKKDFEKSAILLAWQKHVRIMEAWAENEISQTAEQRLARWLRDATA